MYEVGKRIFKTRVQRGMTQIALANAIGITKSMLSKYENDINDPKSCLVARAADVLGVTTDYLFGKSKYETTEESELCIHVTHKEIEILNKYRELNNTSKIRVEERMECLLEKQG